MDQKNKDVTIADVKRLLSRFAADREDKPPKVVETEYGDLLLFLIRLAAKSGVDLMTGVNRALDRRARTMPRAADRRR
jgi:hypothetical protein